MGNNAGRTISIRIPDGVPEEIKAATGMPFSTLVRTITIAALERYRQERRLREASDRKAEVSSELVEIVNTELDKNDAA